MTAEPRGVAQVGSFRKVERATLPEHILRLAQAEYERQFGHRQDYERMQERGGLSVLEVVALLADYLDRLGAAPTTPRALGGVPAAAPEPLKLREWDEDTLEGVKQAFDETAERCGTCGSTDRRRMERECSPGDADAWHSVEEGKE